MAWEEVLHKISSNRLKSKNKWACRYIVIHLFETLIILHSLVFSLSHVSDGNICLFK